MKQDATMDRGLRAAVLVMVMAGACAAINAAGTVQSPPGGGPIQGSCALDGQQIEGAAGSSHVVMCPPSCLYEGGVFGVDVYSGDSAVCRAAIHAGVMTDAGGPVLVTLDAGQPAFQGSARNGVVSFQARRNPSSFRVARP